MSRTTRALATLHIAGRIAAGIGPVEAVHPTEGRALAAVRQGTARYHHPAPALADGYVTTEHRVVPPEGR
ncbi:MAG: hypothetical protein M3N15_07970 [Actinomycetota bacterium]|nr:hypothetical protein [Actinomycetota bacterium]